jgi:hypothetical protein
MTCASVLKERNQGGKGETPGVSTPLVLHWYSTSTPLEKKYQWSTTGGE